MCKTIGNPSPPSIQKNFCAIWLEITIVFFCMYRIFFNIPIRIWCRHSLNTRINEARQHWIRTNALYLLCKWAAAYYKNVPQYQMHTQHQTTAKQMRNLKLRKKIYHYPEIIMRSMHMHARSKIHIKIFLFSLHFISGVLFAMCICSFADCVDLKMVSNIVLCTQNCFPFSRASSSKAKRTNEISHKYARMYVYMAKRDLIHMHSTPNA